VKIYLKNDGDDGAFLDVYEGQTFEYVFKVVSIDDATVHVTGLTMGSRVVSVGAQKLDAGTTVRAIERAPEVVATTVAKSR